MYLERQLSLLGKPYTPLFLTCLWKTHYWVCYRKYHHNLDETLRRIYIFLKEHYEIVHWINKDYCFIGFITLFSRYSLKLSRSSRTSPNCFCDEIVSTLLLLNVIERELSLLVLFEKWTSWVCSYGILNFSFYWRKSLISLRSLFNSSLET